VASSPISRRTFLSKGAATAGAAAIVGIGGPTMLSACSSSSSGSSSSTSVVANPDAGVGMGTPKRGGTAIIGTTADIDGFYPASNHRDTNGFLYANTIYDPLTAVAADGSIQPYLAQSVTPDPEYVNWTLTLRPGVTFSDGSPLDAAVVKANFDALASSALTGTPLQILEGVSVVNDSTVTFTCKTPTVSFPALLTSQAGYIVGQSMIDGADDPTPPKPVGTGPFSYANWEPNSSFTATRNPHYWRPGYPYLDQVTFKPIADTTQREQTLKTGGVDLIISIDANTIGHFDSLSGYQVVDSLGDKLGEPDMDFIMLNCLASPTNDLGIRQALAKAINYPLIQQTFGGGLAKPVNGLFPQGSEYWSETGYPTYDPEGAKALVSAYKAQHGTPSLTLTTIPDPRLIRAVQFIQQMWQQVGFKVAVSEIEQATLITNAITGQFQAYTYQQFAAADPDLNFYWWSSKTVEKVGGISLNFARNSDPQIDAYILQGRESPDPATRIAAYQGINERLAADLPYLWLEQTPWSAVGNSQIQNFANATLPSGQAAKKFDNGIFFPTQIWMAG